MYSIASLVVFEESKTIFPCYAMKYTQCHLSIYTIQQKIPRKISNRTKENNT